MLRSSAKQVPRPSMGGCGRGRRALAACCYVPAAARKCSGRDRMGCGWLAGGPPPRDGGRTGSSDSMRDILSFAARRGVGPGLVLLIGPEFGVLDGVAGSDSLLLIPEAARVIAVSVGAEPGLMPPGVLHVGGGRAAFLRLLDEQLRRRSRGRVAGVDEDPAWILRETGIDPLRRRVTESLFT